MDTSGYIFLLIFAAAACLIGAGILISKLRTGSPRSAPTEVWKTDGGSGTSSALTSPESSSPVIRSTMPDVDVPTEKAVTDDPVMMQITIYGNTNGVGTVCCPACDGENEPSAKQCHICGQILSEKGA